MNVFHTFSCTTVLVVTPLHHRKIFDPQTLEVFHDFLHVLSVKPLPAGVECRFTRQLYSDQHNVAGSGFHKREHRALEDEDWCALCQGIYHALGQDGSGKRTTLRKVHGAFVATKKKWPPAAVAGRRSESLSSATQQKLTSPTGR